MFKGYYSYINDTQDSTKEKLDYMVIGQCVGKEFWYCVLAYFVYVALVIIYPGLVTVYLVLLVMFISFMYSTRLCSVGVTKHNLVIVKFSRIKGEIKKIYDVPINEIKYFDYKKRLFNRLNVSFFSKEGDLVKFSCRYSQIRVGVGSKNYKENAKGINKRFKEIQKVLDKGDF